MPGRPRKNEELKKLHGTARADREIQSPDFEKITKIPKPPSYLGLKKEGKIIYETTAEQLAGIGALNEVNITFVFLYAKELQKYIEAEKEITKLGARLNIIKDSNENIIKVERNPLDRMASEYLENSRKLANELGITPASSGKLKNLISKPEEKDPLQALFNQFK